MNLMHYKPITSMHMLHSRWIADWSVDGIHSMHDKLIICRSFIQALNAVMIDNICSIAVAIAQAELILAKLALAFALAAIAIALASIALAIALAALILTAYALTATLRKILLKLIFPKNAHFILFDCNIWNIYWTVVTVVPMIMMMLLL